MPSLEKLAAAKTLQAVKAFPKKTLTKRASKTLQAVKAFPMKTLKEPSVQSHASEANRPKTASKIQFTMIMPMMKKAVTVTAPAPAPAPAPKVKMELHGSVDVGNKVS